MSNSEYMNQLEVSIEQKYEEKEKRCIKDEKREQSSVVSGQSSVEGASGVKKLQRLDSLAKKYGFSFSYLLTVRDNSEDKEIYRKYFDEGKEKDLLDKLMFILANYEADGFISPVTFD